MSTSSCRSLPYREPHPSLIINYSMQLLLFKIRILENPFLVSLYKVMRIFPENLKLIYSVVLAARPFHRLIMYKIRLSEHERVNII